MCMLHNHQHGHQPDELNPPDAGRRHDAPAPWYRTPLGVASLLLIAGIGYVLWTQYRAQVIGFLPFGLLLLCPLMHLFMHRGHGHGRHDDGSSDGSTRGKS